MSVYFIRYLNIYKAYFVYALVFERFNQVANNNWKQFKTLCSCVMLNICILMSILTFFYMKKCDHHLMLDLTITGKTPVITVFYCTDDHVVDTNAKIYAVYLGIMTLITCNLFAFTFKKIFDLKYELSVNDEAIKMENRCTIALIFPVSFQFMETIYIWLFWKVEYLRNDFIVNYQIFTLLTLLATILALQGLSNKVVKTRNRKLGDEEHNVKLTIMEN
uniref:G_PROTEIN_RECEP_F1_2 domain-containing protein n=1 Tax=Rhabditophanes sp. KR3021 TaxID=114890 RepID=A0AC35TJP8_9BILA